MKIFFNLFPVGEFIIEKKKLFFIIYFHYILINQPKFFFLFYFYYKKTKYQREKYIKNFKKKIRKVK